MQRLNDTGLSLYQIRGDLHVVLEEIAAKVEGLPADEYAITVNVFYGEDEVWTGHLHTGSTA